MPVGLKGCWGLGTTGQLAGSRLLTAKDPRAGLAGPARPLWQTHSLEAETADVCWGLEI